MIKLGILGSRGRMGQQVLSLLQLRDYSDIKLVAQANQNSSLLPLLKVDAVIEFASPKAATDLAKKALNNPSQKLPIFVLGSTGWRSNQLKVIEKLAIKTPVLMSANFSLGVLLVERILRNYSQAFHRLGYQPVITETHHQHKKDAPSGTALLLGRAIESEGLYQGVQTHSIRAGEVICVHEISFYGASDEIKIHHTARDRSLFARGAIEAALWLHRNRKDQKVVSQRGVLSPELFLDELIHG